MRAKEKKRTCPSRGTVATILGDDVSDGDAVTAAESVGVEVFLKKANKRQSIRATTIHAKNKRKSDILKTSGSGTQP